MTTFEGGPAAGVTLMLRRAPIYLRVTRSAEGFDALDLLKDEPAEGEELFAYKLAGKPGAVHIDFTRRSSAWFTVARYVWVAEQPAQEVMRSRSRWRAWCEVTWDADGRRKPGE